MATLSSAGRQPPESCSQQSSAILTERLAAVLPRNYKFGIYHLSTPPTKTDALCSAPPGERPDKTYVEKHFIALSIDVPKEPAESAAARNGVTADGGGRHDKVLVLALEIYVFTTAFSTTVFVSKADSTGYLHLLRLPAGTASPIREVSAAFVSYLVEQRRRKDIQCVVSLFARAQAQYLFPGSVENEGKHVLDDRGLVKWWCRVLHPLAVSPPVGGGHRPWNGVKAYLVIPGLDRYETRAFLPRVPGATERWVLGHPLEKVSHYWREYDWVPARCLIPRYPDDPKSRFRDELDEEANRSEGLKVSGAWRSVRSVDQFWEMMAFRQECSSGRMTGFIWVVFDAVDYIIPDGAAGGSSQAASQPQSQSQSSTAIGQSERPSTPPSRSQKPPTPFTTPRKISANPTGSQQSPTPPTPEQKKKEKKKKKTKKKPLLKGPILPRIPQVKTRQRNYLLDRPTSSPYYYWPPEGRGRRLVDDEHGYKRSTELLLRLDFATLERAVGSTARWIAEVGMGEEWGLEVEGRREGFAPTRQQQEKKSGGEVVVNDLAGSIVKRKRGEEEKTGEAAGGVVNVLGAGLVRKKLKPEKA